MHCVLRNSAGVNYDIHEVVHTDPLIAAIHANAEKFELRAERVFSYLQVYFYKNERFNGIYLYIFIQYMNCTNDVWS
jgi:hypothetical protein